MSAVSAVSAARAVSARKKKGKARATPKRAHKAAGGAKATSAHKGARKTARKASKKASKKATKKASKKASKKTSKKTSRTAAKKGARKTAKKSAKKTARKSAKKTARKKTATRRATPRTAGAPRPAARPAARRGAPPRARTQKILAAAFSGDGRVLATSVGKRVLLWDVSEPAKPRAFGEARTQAEATRLAVDGTGARIAAAVAGFSDVRVRSAGGALLHEVRARGAVTCFAFAPDGRFVVGEVERIGEDGLHARSFITLVDLAGGSELFRTPILDLPIREMMFSRDGLLLFLGFGGGIVVVFDLEARRELFRFPDLEGGEIGARIAASFAFSADGHRAAISWEDVVEIWPIDGGDRIARIELGARTWSVALSRDGTRVLCGAPASAVWSVAGERLAALPVGHHVVATADGALVLASDQIDPDKGPRLVSAAA
jgi:hypothetical protein